MFTALAIFAVAATSAVGAGLTPAGRRTLARWMGRGERVGLHRIGVKRERAERLNKKQGRPIWESAWNELAPALGQARMIQNAPTWS